MNTIAGEIMAIVKGKFNKKGLGKGGKGGKAPQTGMNVDKDERTCHECGELITQVRPFRTRLPSATSPHRCRRTADPWQGRDGQGKGKKGATQQQGRVPHHADEGQWKPVLPGPSQQQWRSWDPQGQGPSRRRQLFGGTVAALIDTAAAAAGERLPGLFSDGTCYSNR
jgi:hypothetical protein